MWNGSIQLGIQKEIQQKDVYKRQMQSYVHLNWQFIMSLVLISWKQSIIF